jgi:hypothetical protein
MLLKYLPEQIGPTAPVSFNQATKHENVPYITHQRFVALSHQPLFGRNQEY